MSDLYEQFLQRSDKVKTTLFLICMVLSGIVSGQQTTHQIIVGYLGSVHTVHASLVYDPDKDGLEQNNGRMRGLFLQGWARAIVGPSAVVRNQPYEDMKMFISVSFMTNGCWKMSVPLSIRQRIRGYYLSDEEGMFLVSWEAGRDDPDTVIIGDRGKCK